MTAMRLTLKSVFVVIVVSLSALLTLAVTLDVPTARADHQGHLAYVGRSDQPTTVAGSNDVTIAGVAFNPAVITVTAGTTVTWTNTDPFTHTTTSDIGSLDPWDSGHLGPNGTFSKVFNTPGTYHYHCAIHFTIMFGTLIVTGPQPQPPAQVTIDGPTTGEHDVAYTFTATVTPLTTTQPITYVWEATGQSDVTHLSGLSDTIAFTWTAGMTGTQLITATASNEAGLISGTHLIIIDANQIYLPLIMR